MKNKDVKKNLLDHSEAKVRLLGEYLKRYLNIICNDGHTERIHIHDLFCGEGLYDNSGEGSPLVILRAIKDIHFMNVAKLNTIPAIDCHFNDIEVKKIEKVQGAIKDLSLYYPEFGQIEYTSADYQDQLKKLVAALPSLRNQKAFIFIDPYEYKHIKASQIESLMAKRNAEVLLWLPTQFMYRFATNGTPLALKDFIEELVPYKEWKATDSVWNFIGQLKEGFQRRLGTTFFVDTFTIEKDPSTVFCLFFFSSHIKGFEKMLEAKWEIDTEQGKGWNYTGNIPTLFQDLKTNPLEHKLTAFLNNHKRTNGEVYEFTLKECFLPKHTNEIFYNWQTAGKLEVQKTDGEKIRKGAFYIAYNYFSKEPNKVTFKLN
jgi:three-Cys-motif partner protein